MRTRNIDKQELVKKKAIEMLVDIGFEGFSMNKLAQACDISVATLYIYYKDKDDLIPPHLAKILELRGHNFVLLGRRKCVGRQLLCGLPQNPLQPQTKYTSSQKLKSFVVFWFRSLVDMRSK